jgi:hypothetical protein
MACKARRREALYTQLNNRGRIISILGGVRRIRGKLVATRRYYGRPIA